MTDKYELPDFFFEGKCYNKPAKFIELVGYVSNPFWATKFIHGEYKFNWSQEFHYHYNKTTYSNIVTDIIAN